MLATKKKHLLMTNAAFQASMATATYWFLATGWQYNINLSLQSPNVFYYSVSAEQPQSCRSRDSRYSPGLGLDNSQSLQDMMLFRFPGPVLRTCYSLSFPADSQLL